MEFYIEQIKSYSSQLLEAINRLLKQLDNTVDPLTEKAIKYMINSPSNRLFVARKTDNKEIIGMLTMIVFRIPFAKKGLLEDLVVDKNHRKKGVATQLIAAVLKKAREERVVYLDFTSHPTRVAANNLYQSLGFKKRDTNIYRILL